MRNEFNDYGQRLFKGIGRYPIARKGDGWLVFGALVIVLLTIRITFA